MRHASRLTFDVIRSPLPLLALLLLAFALRVHALDFQPLWFDEGKSVFFANQMPWDTALLTAEDIHPPLYYYLLHVWALVAEWGPFALRFLSAMSSLLAIPLVYQLGRLLSGRRAVGLLAALFLTLAPMHVYYAQEARMYALLTTLGLASTVLMLQALRAQPRRWLSRRWLAYLLITIAALYTHYYAVFIPLFQTVWVLWWAWRDARQRRHLWPWLGRMALLGLAYVPWVLLSYQVLTSYVVAKVAHEAYAPLPPWQYLVDHLLAFGGSPEAALVFGVLAGCGVVAVWRSARQPARPMTSGLLLYLLVPLAAGLVINLYFPFHPPYYERQFLYVAPAWYLLAAAGLVGLLDVARRAAWAARWQWRLLPIGAAVLVMVAIVALNAQTLHAFYTTPRNAADDYRPLMARARGLARPGDAVVCIYPWQVGYFQSYLAPRPRPMLYYVPYTAWDEPAGMEAGLDKLLSGYPRLWFPSYQAAGRVLETRVEAYLGQKAYMIDQEWYENNKLSFHASPRPLPAPLPGARFGDAVTLI
ncbi:MAG: glycosyltransferase family 39 protein [Chloroflexi bacterium]|nr:glycosyltransferase family 39 protein [Chloroflexota bacterium]